MNVNSIAQSSVLNHTDPSTRGECVSIGKIIDDILPELEEHTHTYFTTLVDQMRVDQQAHQHDSVESARIPLHQQPVRNEMTAGIDMGDDLWVLCIQRPCGKESTYQFRSHDKERRCYEKLLLWRRRSYIVHVVYEAGRYGFTPAREMRELKLEPHIVAPNKFEFTRKRRPKTDKLDARFLSLQDVHGPRFSEVYVPTLDEEDGRRMLAEERRLKKDIKRRNQQILSLIQLYPAARGIAGKFRTVDAWREVHNDVALAMSATAHKSMGNMIHQLAEEQKLLDEHQQAMTERAEARENAQRAAGEVPTSDLLAQFRGIAIGSGRLFCWRLGCWTRFKNGKKFGNYFGLAPLPDISCTKRGDRGISKAGAGELRHRAVQLAWLWKRHQPDSELTKRWLPQLNLGGKARRIAIVALARQLMVALWRYVVKGEAPAGAVINRPVPVLAKP